MESDITQFQAILNRVGAEKDEAIQSATKWAVDQSLLALRQQEEIERLRAELAAAKAELVIKTDELAAAIKQRDEARELYCRHIAYQMSRLTGVFDPKEIAIKHGWDCFGEKEEGGA